MAERKFCWQYYEKATGQCVLVQRPHRRAARPCFYVKQGPVIFVIPFRKFYAQYTFIGRVAMGSMVV